MAEQSSSQFTHVHQNATNNVNLESALEKALQEKHIIYRKNYRIGNLTTFKIGGNALFYAEPSTIEELQAILKISAQNEVEIQVIGKGSNLLINDGIIQKFIINLTKLNQVKFLDDVIFAQAGYSFPRLVARSVEEGLGGLEKLVGIPATVGGAVFMNAGTRYGEIKDFLVEIHCVDKYGDFTVIKHPEKTCFEYRHSGLEGKIIVGCKIKLSHMDKNIIIERFRRYATEKKNSQPLCSHSAGCIFKNPAEQPAGKLIELAGLKGYRVGNAHISTKHANFIINDNNATFNDVMKIVEYAQKTVFKQFGIPLELEVKVW